MSDGPGSLVGRSIGEVGDRSGSVPSKENVKKLDQIIQNFFAKAAVLIIQSRRKVTPLGGKANQWFGILTDDIEEFREELRVFRTSRYDDNPPPPMTVEVYLDASRLSNGQSLVIVDENGSRYDVLDALNASATSSGGSSPSRSQRRNNEVVLERWTFNLNRILDEPNDYGPLLPNVYKRSIVFFRTLYIMTQILPAFAYARQNKVHHPALEVKCRIFAGEPEDTELDSLRVPLYDAETISDYVFGDLEIPVGRFGASVRYRSDCTFRVDNSESLLSSRFMGVDENFFTPTLSQQRRVHGRTDSNVHQDVGSLPAHMQGRDGQEAQQTYGSLSTFHGVGALGTSPISALRAVRPAGSDTSSVTGSVPGSVEPDASQSLPIRSGHSSVTRPSLKNIDPSRRPSVSLGINPFKNGSVSGSPRLNEAGFPSSPSHSRAGSYSGLSVPGRTNRSSLTAGMAASLRGGPQPSTAADQPVVGSPRPQATSRYSSSFGHRRGRPSFGGQSRPGDDDQASSGSGRQSLSSSAQPGSGLLTEAVGAASSGSFQADDDNLSEFLKALDSRKTLKSFEPNQKGDASAAKRTAAQLSKFALMRESNNALTESMTSSMQFPRSSSSSSRQLANVPSMMPASMSTSSSPGMKPLSPHTPHTPAIPSRLSENSIIDYPGGHRQGAHRLATTADTVSEADVDTEGGDGEETQVPVSQEGTTAIDIPLSPRLLQSAGNTNRRASSVAHQKRSATGAAQVPDDDDVDVLGQRSISLGAEDREAPTLSTLLGKRSPKRDKGDDNPTSSAAGRSAGKQLSSGLRPSTSSTSLSQGKSQDQVEPKGESPGSHHLSGAYRTRY